MRLLCPWNFLGKNTGMGCHFLLQGFSRPRDPTHISCVCLLHWQADSFPVVPPGKPHINQWYSNKNEEGDTGQWEREKLILLKRQPHQLGDSGLTSKKFSLYNHKMKTLCVLSCFSQVWLFATLWTVACQAPVSMGFSRQECWSGLPCLLGDLSVKSEYKNN